MRSKLVVVAIAALVAIAAADALRPHASVAPRTTTRPQPSVALSIPPVEAVYAQEHVVQSGRVVLTPEQIDRGFPAPLSGPFTIQDLIVERDGTIAVAVVRFPPARQPRGAIEFWRKGRFVGGFTLPAELLSDGLGLSPGGRYLATYSAGHTRATFFDRRGNRVASVSLR